MLDSRTALLLALRRGPAYGRLLIRRVSQATGGRVSLAPGSVYPALRALERAGQLRRWTVAGGRARGARARAYYELTVGGVREAETRAGALAGIALGAASAVRVPLREQKAMRARIERVGELYAAASELRGALAGGRRR